MPSSRLTIEMLEGVVALARNRTFERAAHELGITPSALHKRIDRLNEVFGVALFVRTGDGMALIQEAQGLVEEGSRVIEYALFAERRFTAAVSNLAGRVRVGHSTHIPPKLLSILNVLVAERPSGLKLESRGDLTLNLKRQVILGDLDAGIGFLSTADSELVTHLLFEDPVVVCVPLMHHLATRAVVRPEDLVGEPIIAVSRTAIPALHDEIDRYFNGFGITLHIVREAFGPPEALTLVEQNQGICLLGSSAVGHYRVSAKPLSPSVLKRRTLLFVRQNESRSETLLFVDLLLRRTGRR